MLLRVAAASCDATLEHRHKTLANQMSDTQGVLITVNGRTKCYSPAFQTNAEYERAWQQVLKDGYGHAEVCCTCRGVGPKRLATKSYEFSGSYALAKFGLSGNEHSADCQFYSANAGATGPGGSGAGVLDVQADGSVRIRLEIGLNVREAPLDNTPAPSDKPDRPGSTRQSAIKLVGLLHYLWDAATLNQWRPYWAGKRNFRQVFWRLNQAADDVCSGTVNLADQLLPAMAQDAPEAARNRSRVESALAAKRRMLIIAPLASYSVEREERMAKDLAIAGFHGIPKPFVRPGQWDLLNKRYRAAVAGWKAGQTVIVIAQVEVKEREGRQSATVVDAALMAVTQQWIPTESATKGSSLKSR